MEDVAWTIHRLGREQHSIVTWAQLRNAGASKEWIDQQVRAGRLIREAPSAYRPWGVPRAWELRASGAVLSARAPALVSHRSAAYLYRIDEHMPGFIDITVPRHQRPRRRPGITFHESRAFDLAAPRIIDRLPVTGPARTILDCCAVLPDPQARLDLFDEARRLKLVQWDDLWECLLLHAGRGRHGWTAYRRILLERDGEVPPGTRFARRVGLLLEEAGLPSPVYEYPVEFCGHDYFIDLAWPARMLAVECLGKIGHEFEKAFESDPVRRNHLQLLGWDVLEITWKRLVHEPQAFVAEIRQSLCA